MLAVLGITSAANASGGTSQPTVVSTSDPVKTSDPTPVVSSTSKPVKTDDPTPVVSSTSKPVKTSDPTPVVSSTPQPVKTNDPTPVVKQEVGLYIYPLLDNTKAPSWENSGLQDLCGSAVGSFTTTPSCTLPAKVCGPGWAYQKDGVKNWAYNGPFMWPLHIKYPVDNIGWPPLYAAKHGLLSELFTVPACTPPPPVHTTVTPKYNYSVPACNTQTYKVEGTNTLTLTGQKGVVWTITKGKDTQTLKADAGFNAAPPFGVGTYTITGADADANDLIDVTPVTATLTFVSAESIKCVAPPVVVTFHPAGPTTTCNTFTVPGVKDGENLIYENPDTGSVTTTSIYTVEKGTYYVTDEVLNGVHTYKFEFAANRGVTVANPGVGDTYTIKLVSGTFKIALWEPKSLLCPIVVPTPTPTPTPVVTPTPIPTPVVVTPAQTPTKVVTAVKPKESKKLAFTGAGDLTGWMATGGVLVLLIGAGLKFAGYRRRNS